MARVFILPRQRRDAGELDGSDPCDSRRMRRAFTVLPLLGLSGKEETHHLMLDGRGALRLKLEVGAQ